MHKELQYLLYNNLQLIIAVTGVILCMYALRFTSVDYFDYIVHSSARPCNFLGNRLYFHHYFNQMFTNVVS